MPENRSAAIAVLDDDALMADLLARLIGNAKAYSDERKFLDESDQFDLALVDWLMPTLTGDEIISELERQGKQVAVIGMSGDARGEAAMRNGGAVDFLLKPFTPAEVHTVVKRVRVEQEQMSQS